MLFYLIYISQATDAFSDQQLIRLLQQSRIQNSGSDITGMLLYIKRPLLNWNNGRFIQLLEGPKDAVLSLYTKIESDNRHKNVTILQQDNVMQRAFPDWSMGWEDMTNKDVEETMGYFDLTDKFLAPHQEQYKKLRLSYLKSFYDMG